MKILHLNDLDLLLNHNKEELAIRPNICQRQGEVCKTIIIIIINIINIIIDHCKRYNNNQIKQRYNHRLRSTMQYKFQDRREVLITD